MMTKVNQDQAQGSHGYPFEASLVKLEAIVEKMEAGDLDLDASLKLFEQGIQLTRECQQALAKAEQKVNLLIEKNGQLASIPFIDPTDD